MTATLQILASVTHTTQGTLSVAGTETTSVKGELRELSFYHTLTRTPQQLHCQIGDALFIEANLTPDPTEAGRLNLQVIGGVNLGWLPTCKDARDQPVLLTGLNLVTFQGHLVADVQVRALDDGRTSVANANLRFGALPGIVETTSYGRTAQSLAGARKGDLLISQGRLVHQMRPDSSGRKKRYDRIETFRLFAGEH